MHPRNVFLARIAKEYLDNMIERLNETNDENEIMQFLLEQADGEFEEVVLREIPQE